MIMLMWILNKKGVRMCIPVAQDRDQWRSLLNTLTNFLFRNSEECVDQLSYH
jgi:hypothetical protein